MRWFCSNLLIYFYSLFMIKWGKAEKGQTLCLRLCKSNSTGWKVLAVQKNSILTRATEKPLTALGPVSRKSGELFGPEKPFAKLRPAYSVKLVFSYVVKGIKIKITAKFRASRRLHFEDTNRIMSHEMRPKSFGTFEKQAPGLWCL